MVSLCPVDNEPDQHEEGYKEENRLLNHEEGYKEENRLLNHEEGYNEGNRLRNHEKGYSDEENRLLTRSPSQQTDHKMFQLPKHIIPILMYSVLREAQALKQNSYNGIMLPVPPIGPTNTLDDHLI